MKRIKKIRALLDQPLALAFPDSSLLHHLQARTAAAVFRNKVRHHVIGLTGFTDEFDVEEFFADNPETVILKHTNLSNGAIRVLAHGIMMDGSGADLSFTLPSIETMREARRQLERINGPA